MGSDFTAFNGLLPVFGNNNRRRCFNVPILEDIAYENDETFRTDIVLSPSISGVTVDPESATIRIIDPDREQ